jgi:hypothetical protein
MLQGNEMGAQKLCDPLQAPLRDARGNFRKSGMPSQYDFESSEFDETVRRAGRRAFDATLAAGLPEFYLDREADPNAIAEEKASP